MNISKIILDKQQLIQVEKELLDADPKAFQQIEFFGQLKNVDGVNADGTQSMFVLTLLEEVKETRLTFSQGSVSVS